MVPTPDGSGNTANGLYKVTCDPEKVQVGACSGIINYQIIEAPHGIVFTGFDKASSSPQRQLSAPAISVDGKMMTFSDQYAEEGPILITLRFTDRTEILYDPELENNPGPGDPAPIKSR